MRGNKPITGLPSSAQRKQHWKSTKRYTCLPMEDASRSLSYCSPSGLTSQVQCLYMLVEKRPHFGTEGIIPNRSRPSDDLHTDVTKTKGLLTTPRKHLPHLVSFPWGDLSSLAMTLDLLFVSPWSDLCGKLHWPWAVGSGGPGLQLDAAAAAAVLAA